MEADLNHGEISMKKIARYLCAVVVFLLGGAICSHAEDALDKWYFRDARVVNKVRFVGGLFIGVGNNGMILTSPDGQTWTARNSGTTASLRGIAFGGLFPNPSWYVAVGTSGTILISSNAVNWSSVAATSCDLNDVAYASLRFVAVTTRATVSQPNALHSQTGTNWTEVFFPNGAPSGFGPFHAFPLLSIGGKLFTAGSDNIVNDIWRSSDDGQNWINQTNSRQATQGIAYGNGRVVAIGYASSGSIALSTNVPSWTAWSFPTTTNVCSSEPGQCMFGNDLVYANGTFVCVRGFLTNGLLISTNGESWTKRSTLMGLQMNSIAFGNGTFVATGANGIYQSEPVSTPGLSIAKNSSSNAVNITVAGEVGRAYRLQTSINISNWFDRLSFTNTSPFMEFVEPITNSSQLFYRAVTP